MIRTDTVFFEESGELLVQMNDAKRPIGEVDQIEAELDGNFDVRSDNQRTEIRSSEQNLLVSIENVSVQHGTLTIGKVKTA